MVLAEILGLRHVKVPVTDLLRSRDWYERVFELEPHLEFPDSEGVVRGVAYRPKGAFTLALRENAAVARAMAGFDPIAILVQSREDIDEWAQRLDDLSIDHSPVRAGALGWLFSFEDPDGIQLKLYSADAHGVDRQLGSREPTRLGDNT